MREYRKTEQYKTYIKKYQQSEQYKDYSRKYSQRADVKKRKSEALKKYWKTEKGKAARKIFQRNYQDRLRAAYKTIKLQQARAKD